MLWVPGCGYSLEAPHSGTFIKYPQYYIFVEKYKKYQLIFGRVPYLELWNYHRYLFQKLLIEI